MAKKQGLPVAGKKPIPVKIVSEPATSNKIDIDREKKWQAEDDLRTIKNYAEIIKFL